MAEYKDTKTVPNNFGPTVELIFKALEEVSDDPRLYSRILQDDTLEMYFIPSAQEIDAADWNLELIMNALWDSHWQLGTLPSKEDESDIYIKEVKTRWEWLGTIMTIAKRDLDLQKLLVNLWLYQVWTLILTLLDSERSHTSQISIGIVTKPFDSVEESENGELRPEAKMDIAGFRFECVDDEGLDNTDQA